MRSRVQSPLAFLGFALALLGGVVAGGADLRFRHHVIDRTLPVSPQGYGDYGLTALVDLDRDGDLDFVVGGRSTKPTRLYWYEHQATDRWVRHEVGTNYVSDVGLAPLDVDRDGWPDLVCSGVWYRHLGRTGGGFERLVFDETAAGAHDVLVADVNGDGTPDVLLMGDERTRLQALVWFSIPADPRRPWVRHTIGPAVHGAITPNGATDVDGDGDLDVLRADTWFENRDGRGETWVPHANVPMGRKGPYGVCVRTAVADLDGDGRVEIIMADADIEDSRVAILRNGDGRGGAWSKTELPRSFTYGSLHSLGVADFDADGRLDIVVNEQEELLPAGRTNPRWVLWENLGGNRFAERIVLDTRMGGHELQVGDVEGDGDADIVSKPWGPRPWNGAAGGMHVDFLENLARSTPSGPADQAVLPAASGAVSTAADEAVLVRRLDHRPVADNEYSRRFRFDTADNPKLRELRARYALDTVVSAGRDEFERQVLLLDWVHRRFAKFGRPTIEARGALEILRGIEEGQTFFCSQYAHLFVSAAAALGWIDRELALRRHQDRPEGGSTEHTTTELWSNRHRKWVMMDPTANMYVEKNGLPLNAYEIRQEWFLREGRDLVFVIGKEGRRYRKADLPIFLRRFEGFGDLTVPADELDKYGFLGFIPNTDLMDAGLDYAGMFIVKDHFCEGTRWHVRAQPADPAVHPYFPLNEVEFRLVGEAGGVGVSLRTMTPNLETYEVRLDGGEWVRAGGEYRWRTHVGISRLEARTVNRFGVRGPAATVEVDR